MSDAFKDRFALSGAEFDALYAQLLCRLNRVAAQYRLTPEDAEDALGVAFLVAGRYGEPITNLPAFLFMAGRRNLVDVLKRLVRTRTCDIDAAGDVEAPNDSSFRERWQDLRDLIANLPECDRSLAKLCLLECCSHADTAEHLDIHVGSVYRKLSAIWSKLRPHLRDAEGPSE